MLISYPHDRFFYPHHTSIIDTFSGILFDLPHLIFKEKSNTFSFKAFLFKFKDKEVDATSNRRSLLYVNIKFFDITALKPTSLDDVET